MVLVGTRFLIAGVRVRVRFFFLGGPMTSFGLRSAPLSHVGNIDDDVGDDGNEW